MEIRGTQIAILGAGGSGYAAAALAVHRGASVTVFDSGAPENLVSASAKFAELGVELICGEAALVAPQAYDLCVISPGIDTAWPIAKAFAAASKELIGEIEFAWRLGPAPLIAITGTNGKTTTTSLVETMLQAAGLRAIAAGNIGLAYSEVVLSGQEYDWIVLELSSFQLETVSTFSPAVAVWMNFAADHMDRYATIEDYWAAKHRLFEGLDPEALTIRKLECDLGISGREVTFSAFTGGGDFQYAAGEIHHIESSRHFDFSASQLHGRHNAENMMVALAVADELGIEWGRVEEALTTFTAPPHRSEKIAEIDGVTYVNDSKSTNLSSLESALAGQEEPVVLIVGGKNKGLDFTTLRELAGTRVREAICIGEIAETIADAWGECVSCHLASSLEEAVHLAQSLALPKEIVLFSPGTSSFDMFKNYEARGESFREIVHQLADA